MCNFFSKMLFHTKYTILYKSKYKIKGSILNLTHLDENNKPKMVDVSDKENTTRVAVASGIIKMSQEAYDAIVSNQSKKGPVLQTAIIAAIQGAKKTSDLIPMCHPLMLTSVKCNTEELPNLPGFKLEVRAKLSGQTGVEMEALNGVSIGLLTIYDMIKAIDKSMVISDIQLESKIGGKSGQYTRG
jgi:cyclic pyranopterin phosphate synthase